MAAYTEEELKKKRLPELKDLAAEHAIDLTGLAKGGIIEALLDIEDDEEVDDLEPDEAEDTDTESDDEVDDEEEDDEELEVDDEEDDVEEAPKPKAKTAKAKAPAKPKVDADGKPTIAAKQVATYLGTEAKTLRQFLRSPASTFEAVGSGGRYEFSDSDLPKIKSEFEAWKAGHAGRGAKRGKNADPEAKSSAPEVEIEELDEDEELDDTPAPKAKAKAKPAAKPAEDDEIDDDEIDDEDLELDE